MPNQPKDPIYPVRVPVELKRAAMAKAAEEDRVLSDVIREFLVTYVGD